jgi:hypothetical protein
VDAPSAAQHTDPTIAHAGLTEQDDIRIPNGNSDDIETAGPPTGTVFGNAGNAAAEERWDTKAAGDIGMEESFEMVPRDPQETENRETHAPALAGSTQSWADETSAAAESADLANPGVAPTNGDGFQEVAHHGRGGRGPRGSGGASRGQRGGSRGSGEFKGERRGGPRGGDGFRGRGRGGEGGFRGEGRGRGGPRGGRGAPRGESS